MRILQIIQCLRGRILKGELQKKRISVVSFVTLILFFNCFELAACQWAETSEVKEKDLPMLVLSQEVIPKKLMESIEERKTKPFKMSFKDEKNLYICVGYGQKDRPGYSVVVEELYKSNLGIHISTTLLGPMTENNCVEKEQKESSYPYLVIRTELSDEPVIYQ